MSSQQYHYDKAERIIAETEETVIAARPYGVDAMTARALEVGLQLAQVHATLATITHTPSGVM